MSEKVGYARVSTASQKSSLEAQIERLTNLGCIRVFSDVASGAKADRPGLEAALDFIRPGDTLTVTHLDRLGKLSPEAIQAVKAALAAGMTVKDVASLHGVSRWTIQRLSD